MRMTVCDARNLAVALIQPANDRYLNWATGLWEPGPFDPSRHARPLVPMGAAPSPFAGVQDADIGAELLSRPDAAAVLLTVSGSGAAAQYIPVDLWTLPIAPYHCTGGFARL